MPVLGHKNTKFAYGPTSAWAYVCGSLCQPRKRWQ